MKKAEATRLNILQKAFDLIYRKGYQATSVDDILATTKVTKGAFYYHFRNKDDMGMAIIQELMKPAISDGFTAMLQGSKNPLDGIYAVMHNLLLENDFLKVEYGCPAANLTQEMTPWQVDFSVALKEVIGQWTERMTAAIEEGIRKGLVREEVKAGQVTFFVLSGYWGIRNFGKLENNKDVYRAYLAELLRYLNTLKVA